MKRFFSIVLLLPLTLAAATGSSLKPGDFAYGMPLEVDGDGALYSFELPTEVCRYSTRHDLGDLRIFNGYSEVVPHLLSPGVKPEITPMEPVELPFFPIMETGDPSAAQLQINIATDDKGAVIDFWQRGEGLSEGVVGRYLIDASALQQPLEKLLLDWGKTEEGFMIPVVLESSNDLADWSEVKTSTSLASLSQGGYRLRQNEIILPSPSQAKYYRLSWPLGKKGILLTSLQGMPLQQGAEIPRRWQQYRPTGEADRSGQFLFHVDGHYPFDRARIVLPQNNTVVSARLFSRSTAKDALWRHRFQGLLYKLIRDGHELSNESVQMSVADDADWKLEIETDGGGLGGGKPLLELGWVPQRVYFVARGEGPFTLAFASAAVSRSQSDISSLLETLQQSRQGKGFIKSAVPGSMYELGGSYRLKTTPPPLPWQRWLLWATLLIGVLIVALMARSLYRQMNAENGEE